MSLLMPAQNSLWMSVPYRIMFSWATHLHALSESLCTCVFLAWQGGSGGVSPVTVQPSEQQEEQSTPQDTALNAWLDEDFHELPAITVDVSLRLLEILQGVSLTVRHSHVLCVCVCVSVSFSVLVMQDLLIPHLSYSPTPLHTLTAFS